MLRFLFRSPKSPDVKGNKRGRSTVKDETKAQITCKNNTEEAKNSPKKRLRISHHKPRQIVESIRETTAVELSPCFEGSTSETLSISITANGDTFIPLQEPKAETIRNVPFQGSLEDRPDDSKNIPVIFPPEISVVGLSKVTYIKE